MDMKKILMIFMAALLGAASIAGCSDKKSSSSAPKKAKEEKPAAVTYEEAYRETFDSMYSADGGEAFYEYTYPQSVIDYMKENGDYDSRIEEYNTNAEALIKSMDNIPTIKEITECSPLTDEQLKYAKNYFFAVCSGEDPDFDMNSINITEGYELTSSITDEALEDREETWCMLKFEGDGWKAYTGSAQALEENFKETDISA